MVLSVRRDNHGHGLCGLRFGPPPLAIRYLVQRAAAATSADGGNGPRAPHPAIGNLQIPLLPGRGAALDDRDAADGAGSFAGCLEYRTRVYRSLLLRLGVRDRRPVHRLHARVPQARPPPDSARAARATPPLPPPSLSA